MERRGMKTCRSSLLKFTLLDSNCNRGVGSLWWMVVVMVVVDGGGGWWWWVVINK